MKRSLSFELEFLEGRALLSAGTIGNFGYTPAQIRHAYGFDKVVFKKGSNYYAADGSGQTIAIVDAMDDPTIYRDLEHFDAGFGISNLDSTGEFAVSRAFPGGKPAADPGWAQEISLDVEWAHAIAPKAHILLVEASSADVSDLLSAVDYARKQPGVTEVSMSWGSLEFPSETQFDSTLTTPKGHEGVTFITASGDDGAPAGWPAVSPNVIAVAGTTLTLNSNGSYGTEVGWVDSGGGFGQFENTHAPDVAFNADPNTGYAVYDSAPGSDQLGWQEIGGTSAGSPQWAGLFAIVNQGRALHHIASLDGPTQSLEAIDVSLPRTLFHDITQGSNGFDAKVGYDLVTGWGSPVANHLIDALVDFDD